MQLGTTFVTVVENAMLSRTSSIQNCIQHSQLHAELRSALIATCMCRDKQHMQIIPVNIQTLYKPM